MTDYKYKHVWKEGYTKNIESLPSSLVVFVVVVWYLNIKKKNVTSNQRKTYSEI